MATVDQVRRLYKSRTDRMIDGVCGGIAEYFGLDPTLIRITWVLLTLIGGTGILLYIVCMLVMPANPSKERAIHEHSARHNSKFWGMLLVAVGCLWLMNNLGVQLWGHWWGFSWDALLPVLLILAGVGFLFGGRNYIASSSEGTQAGSTAAEPAAPSGAATGRMHRLYKSRMEKKIFGVCGGIGEFVEIDPVLVRVLFVVGAFASFGVMLLLYVVMALIVPYPPSAAQTA